MLENNILLFRRSQAANKIFAKADFDLPQFKRSAELAKACKAVRTCQHEYKTPRIVCSIDI